MDSSSLTDTTAGQGENQHLLPFVDDLADANSGRDDFRCSQQMGTRRVASFGLLGGYGGKSSEVRKFDDTGAKDGPFKPFCDALCDGGPLLVCIKVPLMIIAFPFYLLYQCFYWSAYYTYVACSHVCDALSRCIDSIVTCICKCCTTIYDAIANCLLWIYQHTCKPCVDALLRCCECIWDKCITPYCDLIDRCFKAIGKCIESCCDAIGRCICSVCNFIYRYTCGPVVRCISAIFSLIHQCCSAICGCLNRHIYSPIGRCVSCVCGQIWACISAICNAIYDYVLAPIGRCFSAIGGFIYDNVMAPIGRFLASICAGLASIARAVCGKSS